MCISSAVSEQPGYDMYLAKGHRIDIIVVIIKVTHSKLSLLKSLPICIATVVDPALGNVEAYLDRLKVVVIHIGRARGLECQKSEEDGRYAIYDPEDIHGRSYVKKPSRECR